MPSLTGQSCHWTRSQFDSGDYFLIWFGKRIIAVQYSPRNKEGATYELGQFVQNIDYQKDGVPIGTEGYIIEIRNPDAVSRRSIGDNDESNGGYIIDVMFERYGVRRRKLHQIEHCLQWWESNPIDSD